MKSQEVIMEKISGIIPRNARNSSADVSKSQPVRPGAPSFGRPIGKVTQRSALQPEDSSASQIDNVPAKLAESFFIDNKQARQVDSVSKDNTLIQEDVVEDKITFSPNFKELKKLQDESNDFETEILTRVDNSQKPGVQQTSQQQVQQKTAQYNKKGESVKTKIANDVSNSFASIEA